LNRWASADPLALHGLGADPNLYAYVHGRVLIAIDPDGLEEIIRELTKQRLEALASVYGVGNNKPELYRQRKIGRWFQNSLLDSLGMQENGRDFPSGERATKTAGKRQNARPDGVTSLRLYKANPNLPKFVRGLEYLAHATVGAFETERPNASFYEMKAKKEGETIRLADNEHQITGLIDAVSKQGNSSDPIPAILHFVTTKGVRIHPEVTDYATKMKVVVMVHVAEEIYDTVEKRSRVRVGEGTILNSEVLQPGVTYDAPAGRAGMWRAGPNGSNLIVGGDDKIQTGGNPDRSLDYGFDPENK
jgi:hypothetical protein